MPLSVCDTDSGTTNEMNEHVHKIRKMEESVVYLI